MIRYFARHGNAANLLMLAILVVGIMGASSMIRETFRDFRYDRVIIETVYKGATAQEVEESICTNIEEAIESIAGIEKVTSTAREGFAKVIVQVREGHPLDRLAMDVKNEVDRITLPEDADIPIVYVESRNQDVINIGITGKVSTADLKNYSENIRKELLQNPHVSSVKLLGFPKLEILIKVDHQVIHSLNITVQQLSEIIRSQSRNLPVGEIKNTQREIIIRVIDQKYNLDEFANTIIIASPNGALVKLSDIAEISWNIDEQKQSCLMRDHLGNNKRMALMMVYKMPGEDALKIREEVHKFVHSYQKKLPENLEIRYMLDAAKVIEDRLSLLQKNGIQGFILVFLTLWLFLGVRSAFWVAMGIPFSFLGALWLMYLTGHTVPICRKKSKIRF